MNAMMTMYLYSSDNQFIHVSNYAVGKVREVNLWILPAKGNHLEREGS